MYFINQGPVFRPIALEDDVVGHHIGRADEQANVEPDGNTPRDLRAAGLPVVEAFRVRRALTGCGLGSSISVPSTVTASA